VLSDVSVVLCGSYLVNNSAAGVWIYVVQNILGLAPITFLMILHYSSFSHEQAAQVVYQSELQSSERLMTTENNET
jgi:phosphoserine aminotransferase